jgi:hypothetical protein
VLAKGFLEKRIERAILLGVNVSGNAGRVTLEPKMVHVKLLTAIVKEARATWEEGFSQ